MPKPVQLPATGESLFGSYVNHCLSTRGGLQGYCFDALTEIERSRWDEFAKSINVAAGLAAIDAIILADKVKPNEQ